MLFSLTYVDHLIENFNSAPLTFFQQSVNARRFDNNLFPQWFWPVLSTSPVLRQKFKAVFNLLVNMSQQERADIYNRFVSDVDIEQLCNDENLTPIYTITEYPLLHTSLLSLFNHLYNETLQTSVSLNNALNTSLVNYHADWKARNPFIVCPFCGLENYSSSIGTNRDPYDHFLCKSKYPLSAINFKNLIPIGDKCNQTAVKGEIDILHNEDFIRRRAFYPYTAASAISIKIICITPPSVGYRGEWDLEITCDDPHDTPKLLTWMEVFNIKERYLSWIKDFLDGWKEAFTKYLTRAGIVIQPSIIEIKQVLASWKNTLPAIEIFSGALLLDAYIDHLLNDAQDSSLLAFCNVQLSLP